MIFDWPANLEPIDITIMPPRKTVGLNTSLTEFTQAVPGIRPPFGLKLEFDGLFGNEVLAYRALLASLEGRANLVRVPLFDLVFSARDSQVGIGLTPHSDDMPFSDAAEYLTDDLSGVLVTGVQGQRNITADFGEYGPLLQGGQYFGLGDQPYIARAVWWEGSVATINCSPTLRSGHDMSELRLRPVMIVRQTSDDGGELRRSQGGSQAATLEFREAFDEPVS